jgi:carbon starvation protein CstA
MAAACPGLRANGPISPDMMCFDRKRRPVHGRLETFVVVDGPEGWRGTEAPQTRCDLFWERHSVALRIIAVVALCWGAVYLARRLWDTGRGISWWAFCPLWLVELYNFTWLGFLAYCG